MDREVFKKAPITEALLNIKVQLPPEISLSNLEQLHEDIEQYYPVKREIQTWEGGLEFKSEGEPMVAEPTRTVEGFIFKSVEGNTMIQARFDGFTFHMLPPYSEWEDFIGEAKKIWSIYKNLLTPVSVQHLGLRYINRIEIPLPIQDLREYLLTVPDVSSTVDYPLSGFFMRLVMKDTKSDAVALVTETIDQENTAPNMLPVIFDTDVKISDLEFGDNVDFWSEVEKMRKFKNSLFFNSLTEKGKELFR